MNLLSAFILLNSFVRAGAVKEQKAVFRFIFCKVKTPFVGIEYSPGYVPMLNSSVKDSNLGLLIQTPDRRA